jgi:hypothetical protein
LNQLEAADDLYEDDNNIMGDLEKEFDAMGSGNNKANPFG